MLQLDFGCLGRFPLMLGHFLREYANQSALLSFRIKWYQRVQSHLHQTGGSSQSNLISHKSPVNSKVVKQKDSLS